MPDIYFVHPNFLVDFFDFSWSLLDDCSDSITIFFLFTLALSVASLTALRTKLRPTFPLISFSVPCLSLDFFFIHGLGFVQALLSLPDRISWMVFVAFFLRPEQLGHGVGKFLLISLPTVHLILTAHLASTF